MYNSYVKKTYRGVFLVFAFVLLTHNLCFADAQTIECVIAGTGPGKIWLNKGSEHGVIEDMTFEIKRGGEIIGKVKIKKADKMSSEAVPVVVKDGFTLSSGDSAVLLTESAAVKDVKEEQKTPAVVADTETKPLTEEKTEVKKKEPEPVKTSVSDSVSVSKEKQVEAQDSKKDAETKKKENLAGKPKKKEKPSKKHKSSKWGRSKGAKIALSAVVLLLLSQRF